MNGSLAKIGAVATPKARDFSVPHQKACDDAAQSLCPVADFCFSAYGLWPDRECAPAILRGQAR